MQFTHLALSPPCRPLLSHPHRSLPPPLSTEQMDSATIVKFIYEVGKKLVKRCGTVQQCHTEATRIAVRTLRALGSLEGATGEFAGSAKFAASLIDLMRVLEEAYDLVKVNVVLARMRVAVTLFVNLCPSPGSRRKSLHEQLTHASVACMRLVDGVSAVPRSFFCLYALCSGVFLERRLRATAG